MEEVEKTCSGLTLGYVRSTLSYCMRKMCDFLKLQELLSFLSKGKGTVAQEVKLPKITHLVGHEARIEMNEVWLQTERY